MAYLKGLLQQAATWKEIKLLFVGEEGVGKSSLLESFQNSKHKMKKDPGQNLATDGIAMSEWQPPERSIKV
jgi:GTPase SAR1 family protein